MGARRESMALSPSEKELTAYHEAGHAVCAVLLENADPLHKVTILPIGMALGVTQQLPAEDRHSYNQHYLEDSIVVAMGGRVAEQLVFGVMTTGAGNDLEVSTSRARRMVTEWGMSPKVGPQAWGGSGQVFLGEDLMQSRESYSGRMANVIDEEIERILREAEERCRTLLTENRGGLNMVARSLLEHETIDGATVKRLVAMAQADPLPADSTAVD
jgi:cell division protease FtsH